MPLMDGGSPRTRAAATKKTMGPFVPGTEPKNSIQAKWMNDNPEAPVSRQAKSYTPGSPVKALLDRPEPKVNTSSLASLLGLADTTRTPTSDVVDNPLFNQRPKPPEERSVGDSERGKSQYLVQGGQLLRVGEDGGEPQPMITGPQATDTAAAAESMAARAKREMALRTNARPTKGEPAQNEPVGKVKPMTWEEYEALSPRARAAVDFNTMLVAAVNKDKANQETYKTSANKQERAQYEVGVQEMFGEQRGSDLYAPETMAVLQQIKFRDAEADLDDFLGLRAAITTDDLKNIDKVSSTVADNPLATPDLREAGASSPLTEAQTERQDLVKNIATSTEKAIDEQMSKAKGVLQDFQATTYAERSESVGFLGGVPSKVELAPGFGNDELSSMIQTAYTQLTTSDPNSPEIQTMLTDLSKGRRAGDPEAIQFYDYLNTRVEQSKRYGTPLGDKNVKYRSAEQLAAALGL